MLEAADLQVIEKIPLFVLLEPPLFKAKMSNLIITSAYFGAGVFFRLIPPLGNWVGKVLYLLDNWLIRKQCLTQNHMLYVIRAKPNMP
jgi:hypothetical protein